MTERREQRAARELKANYSPSWLQDHADGFQLDYGILFVEGRYDDGTNAVVVKIKLFADSEESLQTFSFETLDHTIDVRALADAWVKQQMVKYITKILEVKA